MSANVIELLNLGVANKAEQQVILEAESGRSFTWQQLAELADRLAAGLQDNGVVPKDRVLVALGNRAEFVVAYLACVRLGAVFVPVNPKSVAGEISRMLQDSGAVVAIGEAKTAAVLREGISAAASAAKLILVAADVSASELSWESLLASTTAVAPVTTAATDLAVLLYTSGTSGRPRAAMLSTGALMANLDQVAQIEPPLMSVDDVVLGVLPLFHVYGLNAVLGQVLKQQARLVLVADFDPNSLLEFVQQHQISVLPIAPPVVAYWRTVPELAKKLGSVRLIISGSAPLATELVKEFSTLAGLTVHQGYGLTEASPVVTTTLSLATPAPSSVGAPVPGVEIAARDEQGMAPEVGDPGEIWIRGANLFSGFWPDGQDGPDADGWFATGDVGFIDEAGNLTLVDRLKELIIVSGFNVYPTEVEEVIRSAAGVAEAAVIGVPDEFTGEQVVAYVVAKPEATEVAAEVQKTCELKLARFKRPGKIQVVDSLPYSVTGKVQKGRLRAVERRLGLDLLG